MTKLSPSQIPCCIEIGEYTLTITKRSESLLQRTFEQFCETRGFSMGEVLCKTRLNGAVNRREDFVNYAFNLGFHPNEIAQFLQMHRTNILYLLKGRPRKKRK